MNNIEKHVVARCEQCGKTYHSPLIIKTPQESNGKAKPILLRKHCLNCGGKLRVETVLGDGYPSR
jgi:hypothetical protein